MTWTTDNFPPEMLELEPKTREIAIEIANELMKEQNYDRETAIAEAIEQAKQKEIDEQG